MTTPTKTVTNQIVRIAFTECEADHILSLVENNERDGTYTSPREQYWKRSERIKSKLTSARKLAQKEIER